MLEEEKKGILQVCKWNQETERPLRTICVMTKQIIENIQYKMTQQTAN